MERPHNRGQPEDGEEPLQVKNVFGTKKIRLRNSPGPAFLNLARLTFGIGNSWLWEGVLCSVSWLAVHLAFIHKMPAPPVLS
jgi:hypothetical protein